MKGIILAGGSGSRLYPLTKVTSKQLHAIYDKPMIYYPLATLMEAGIRDILIISTPSDVSQYQDLLGDGSQWGISLEYVVQEKPNGLAQAFVLGENFIGEDDVTLILGDNLFYGESGIREAIGQFKNGARVFGYQVQDPERYGVVEFAEDMQTVLSLEEKPLKPKSDYAVPGIYVFDKRVVEVAKGLKPSARGEYEIIDVIKQYLEWQELSVSLMGRGVAWLDTGTHQSLLEASHFIYTIEARQGLKIACLEEIAYGQQFIDANGLRKTLNQMPNCPYKNYIEKRFAKDLL